MEALALSEQPFARLDPAAVGKLCIPTLVLRGEVTDELHTLGAAELARRVTDCRTAVIAAAGHRSSMENPNEFNRVVLAFLESFA
jgi:pimeloyl-ACP methyl ester carboxylesterase